MNTTFFVLWALFLTGSACAGDLYTCKDASGHTAYQQVPCPASMKTSSVRSYQSEPVRSQSWSDQQQSGAGYTYASAPVQQTRVQLQSSSGGQAGAEAYQCTANGAAWIQQQPCPATTQRRQSVQVHGTLVTTGEPVEGTATLRTNEPVQTAQIDQATLCRRMRDGAARSEHTKKDRFQSDSADDAYDYNTMHDHVDGC